MHVHRAPFTRTPVRENQPPFPVSEALVCQAVDLSVWLCLITSRAQSRTSRLGPAWVLPGPTCVSGGEGCGLLGHLPRPGPRVSPHTPENINE